MVVLDPRLALRKDPKKDSMQPIIIPTRPPAAKQAWTVSLSDTADHITGWTAKIAADWGKMDALHYMAHGKQGFIQIGADGFSRKNVHLFERYSGKVKTIVFLSCLVGADVFNPSVCSTEVSFAQAVAQKSGAKVVACKQTQQATISHRTGEIDYKEFEGDVFVIQPDGCTYKTYNDQQGRKLNLEKLILGYSLYVF